MAKKKKKEVIADNLVKKLEEGNIIEDSESLKACNDNDVLEKALDERKLRISVEDIHIKVLEENIIKLNEKILEIQEKEKQHIEEYIKEHEDRKFQLEEEYKVAKEKLEEEKDAVIKEYQEKKDKLDDIYWRRDENQKIEYQKTLKDLGNMRTSLEKEFDIKNKDLDEKYLLRNQELTDEFDKREKDLEEKHKKLDEEYLLKNQELIDEFNKKEKEIVDNFNEKERELLEEYNAKSDFLKDYEEELKENNNLEYESLMNKIKTAKEDFEALMQQQKELFQKEIELRNQEIQEEAERININLKEKEEAINNDYNEKMTNLKQSEIEFLQKENELNIKIDDLNNKVKTFNDTRNKFVKRHYLVHRFYKQVQKHKIAFGISIAVLFIFIVHLGLVFEYDLFRKSFISEAISNVENTKSYDNNISVYLDTSNSSFAKFTELDGLTIKMNYKFSDVHYQNLNTYQLNFTDNNYKWQRYYKNNTMIAKSAFYNQYIIVEDFDKYDYSFNENEEIDIFLDSFRKFLAKKNNFDFKEVNRLNINGNGSFFKYLKNILFLSSNYEYHYNLTSSNNKECNRLFKDLFNIFLDCENYKSFELEEADIQQKLGMVDILANSKLILKNILKYSEVNSMDINIKISEGNKAKVLDIYFYLDYKDDTMVNSVPMGIRMTCELDDLDEGVSLDKNDFTTNAIFYEGLRKE